MKTRDRLEGEVFGGWAQSTDAEKTKEWARGIFDSILGCTDKNNIKPLEIWGERFYADEIATLLAMLPESPVFKKRQNLAKCAETGQITVIGFIQPNIPEQVKDAFRAHAPEYHDQATPEMVLAAIKSLTHANKNEEVLNLTQHNATPDQVEAGVVEPANKAAVQAAITFDDIPTIDEINQRAEFIAAIAKESGFKKAMIGGAPFFMSALERALINVGITPVYAFSKRESVDMPQPDGSVKKTQVFKHTGFVEIIL